MGSYPNSDTRFETFTRYDSPAEMTPQSFQPKENVTPPGAHNCSACIVVCEREVSSDKHQNRALKYYMQVKV